MPFLSYSLVFPYIYLPSSPIDTPTPTRFPVPNHRHMSRTCHLTWRLWRHRNLCHRNIPSFLHISKILQNVFYTHFRVFWICCCKDNKKKRNSPIWPKIIRPFGQKSFTHLTKIRSGIWLFTVLTYYSHFLLTNLPPDISSVVYSLAPHSWWDCDRNCPLSQGYIPVTYYSQLKFPLFIGFIKRHSSIKTCQ